MIEPISIEVIDDRTGARRVEYVTSPQNYLIDRGYRFIQKDERGIELWRKDLIFALIVPASEEAKYPVVCENGAEQSILEYWALWVGFIEKKMD